MAEDDARTSPEAAEALLQSENLLRQQFLNSPDIILLIDNQLRILRINRAVAGKHTVEELIGMDAVSILPESAQTLARTRICDCFITGQKQEFEHEIGDGLSVLARVVPIVKRGKVEQVLIVSTNITALKEAERTQRRAARRAQMLLDLLQRTFASESEIVTYAISQLTCVTDSTVGFIGIVDQSETTLAATLWPAQAAPGNTVGDRPIRFDLERGGPWAEAIRSRKSVLSHHDDETNPLRRIDPAGCVRLTRFLAIPVIREGRAVLLAGVGNKAEEYDEWDRAETAIFLEAVWEVIGRR